MHPRDPVLAPPLAAPHVVASRAASPTAGRNIGREREKENTQCVWQAQQAHELQLTEREREGERGERSVCVCVCGIVYVQWSQQITIINVYKNQNMLKETTVNN